MRGKHPNSQDNLKPFKKGELAFFSAKAQKSYLDLPASTRVIVFGPETRGLPKEMLDAYRDCSYQIPIFHSGVRSLNLANAAAIVTYHLLSLRRGSSLKEF